MFALWYMISKPTMKTRKTKDEQFGYKPQFSGLGIFVYRQNNQYKLFAAQDMG